MPPRGRVSAHWAPAIALVSAATLFYAFIALVRFEIGQWPNGAGDWAPLDRGDYQGLIAFGVFASVAVVGSMVASLAWTGVTICHHALSSTSDIRKVSRPVITTWLVAAAFLILGGARFLAWMLD